MLRNQPFFHLFPQTDNCQLLTKQKYHITPMVLNYWLTNLVQSWCHPSDFLNKAPQDLTNFVKLLINNHHDAFMEKIIHLSTSCCSLIVVVFFFMIRLHRNVTFNFWGAVMLSIFVNKWSIMNYISFIFNRYTELESLLDTTPGVPPAFSLRAKLSGILFLINLSAGEEISSFSTMAYCCFEFYIVFKTAHLWFSVSIPQCSDSRQRQIRKVWSELM